MSACEPTVEAPTSFTDENTGREIRVLYRSRRAPTLSYFRLPRHLGDGSMLAVVPRLGRVVVHPDEGTVTPAAPAPGGYLKLRVSDSVLFTYDSNSRSIWSTCMIDAAASPRLLGVLPMDLPGHVTDITCDGRYVITLDVHDREQDAYPPPISKDPALYMRYIQRPRRGRMCAYDMQTKTWATLVETDGYCPFHVDTHATDPTLIRFAYDIWEGARQRVWAVRATGGEPWMMRPQAHRELVTHEFWWSDCQHMGYTYQDRREVDPQDLLPWCEYAPAQTRLGLCDLQGREVYLSDPVNHYHTHQYCSFDGQMVSGSGTDGHSFVYAAHFDRRSTRIDYVPLATTHTPYVPFRGQHINCDFSADHRWLLYTDTLGDESALCAVKVDI